MKPQQNRIKTLSSRYQKYTPLAAFVGGFLYDSVTLTRIDRLVDNLVLLGYTLGAGVMIALVGRNEERRLGWSWLTRHLNLVVTVTHFFIGGLLSSYVVFYFKSAGVGKSLIFVVLLVSLLLANEFFRHRLRNVKLLCGLYFFCCYAFLTFFLPVVTRKTGAGMFVLSGVLSFIPTGLMIWFIHSNPTARDRREWIKTAVLPLAIFIVLQMCYFLNLMPPVPLALKEGGIYRSVKRVGDQYEVTYTQPEWWQFWKKDEREFVYTNGDTVYCFAAIFAPTALREQVVHHWQRLTEQGDWVTADVLRYSIVGGRDGGFRGYTFKRKLTPGRWRVEVQTVEGRLLGRIPFEVVARQERPQRLKTAYR